MIYNITCHNCGYKMTIERKLFRQDTCPKCSSYLRCCLQCRLYDTNAHHECKESEATWVRDKEAANFCDYFEIAENTTFRQSKATDARKKLDDLFKKS